MRAVCHCVAKFAKDISCGQLITLDIKYSDTQNGWSSETPVFRRTKKLLHRVVEELGHIKRPDNRFLDARGYFLRRATHSSALDRACAKNMVICVVAIVLSATAVDEQTVKIEGTAAPAPIIAIKLAERSGVYVPEVDCLATSQTSDRH